MRVTFAVLFSMAACGGEGKSPVDPDALTDPSSTPDGATPEALTDPDLDGTWQFATCGAQQFKRELTINGANLQYRNAVYPVTDPTCTQPYAILNVNQTYSVRGMAPLAANAKKIDFVTEGTTMVVDSVAATYYNTIAYCGITTWKAGVAQDLTGRTCEEDNGSSSTYWPLGTVYHDIYLINMDRLYFGDVTTGSGNSDGTRPTKLGNAYLARQH